MSLTRKSLFTEYKWQVFMSDVQFDTQQLPAADILALSKDLPEVRHTA
jgi:hypothetical protein